MPPLIEIEAETEVIRLRRFHQFPIANPSPLGSSGRATKGRLFYVQYKSQLAPGSEVLCRTSAFPRKGPTAEALSRYLCSVVRIPMAAKPLTVNLPPSMGEKLSNGVRREPQATENTVRRFPSEVGGGRA